MEIPRYLQILWSYKWLLVIGVVVAVLAGLFAGFTIRDGQVISRAERTYTASTTVLLEAESSTLLQAVIPGEEVDQTTTATIRQDLGSVAVLYAYLAASQAMVDRVQAEVGEFNDTEQMTALSRTTQPSGDERFPGRLELPIIDIVGVSSDPERAQEISRTATEEFREYVIAEQQAELIPSDVRVKLTTLDEGRAEEAVGANPAFPIVLTAGGVLLGFIALVYIINGIRARNPREHRGWPFRFRKKAAAVDGESAPADDAAAEDDVDAELADLEELEPETADKKKSKVPVAEADSDDDADLDKGDDLDKDANAAGDGDDDSDSDDDDDDVNALDLPKSKQLASGARRG